MNFLFIVTGDEIFGVRRITLDAIRTLHSAGFGCRVLAVNDGPFVDEVRSVGVDVACMFARPPARLIRSKFRYIVESLFYQVLAIRDLARVLRNYEKSARVVVQWPSLLVATAIACALVRMRCFWMMPNCVNAGRYAPFYRGFYQLLCRYTGAKPLANSYFTALSLGDWLIRAKVVYLGVDTAACVFNSSGRSIVRRQLGISDEAVVFGVFARMDPEKGQDIIIDAFMTSFEADSRFHLLIVGAGDGGGFEASLRARVISLGLSDLIHFIAYDSTPLFYYCCCDIVVSFRIDAEPFGLSVVEAMSLGRPVLVHALGGPAETVIDAVTGWHVRAPTTSALANGFRRSVEARSQWPEIGQAGRVRAESEFDLQVFSRRLLEACR